ncbi:putative CREB-binding protein, partial [Daphnia magna]
IINLFFFFFFYFCVYFYPSIKIAPHNTSQPSPAGFDVGLGSNSIGGSSATPGQSVLPAHNQSAAVGGVQATPNAVGGMPRPLLPPQQQQNAMVPMNSAQLAGNNPPSAISASQPVLPGT